MKTLIGLTLPLLFIFASCNLNQGANSENEYALKKLHNEVMDIHDSVMPRMSEIGKLKRQLNEKLEENADSVNSESIQQMVYQLGEADEAMMNWMGEFKKPDYSDFENAQKVYEQEKSKITTVRNKMMSTISKAKALQESL